MKNKMEQLIRRPSGGLTLSEVSHVYLHSDGRMFGKVLSGVLKGTKVVTNSYLGKVWEVVV